MSDVQYVKIIHGPYKGLSGKLICSDPYGSTWEDTIILANGKRLIVPTEHTLDLPDGKLTEVLYV